MKLQEYLEALEACPDAELEEELGVSDNWPIFLKADFGKLSRDFQESGKYKFKEIYKQRLRLDFIPGTVRLQLFDWMGLDSATGGGSNRTEKDKEHYQRQSDNYNMTILLHHNQEKKMDVPNSRALVMVIDDIGKYIQKGVISACFPCSMGYKYREDYSRIVYFPE
jgi:hypothetical protein